MSADEPASDAQPRRQTPALLEVRATATGELSLRYDDGALGTVDLSAELAAGGVFAGLCDAERFAEVRLGEYGQVEWPNGAELCADALYLRLAHKAPEDLFPGLSRQPADA